MTQNSATVDPTQAENWFVATASSGTVEFSLDDLIPAIQSGRISPRNLVWRQGMSDWLEIEQVPLLRMIAVPVETQPKEAVPVVDSAPLDCKIEAVSGYPVLDEFEATVIQPRLDLLDDNSWTIEPQPCKVITQPATIIQSAPDLLDDNSWTIEPKPSKAITQPAAVIQPAPDSLDDNSWTIEPKPSKATTQAPRSIHDLVKRGAAPAAPALQPPTSKLPVRPALVRPAPSSPVHRHVATTSPPPADIAPIARLATKAPPKPRTSTNSPPSDIARVKAPPPSRVRTSAISSRTATVAHEVSQTPARPAPVSQSPAPSRSTVSTTAQSMAETTARPPISTSVRSATPAPIHLPDSPSAPLSVAVQTANTSQAPYSGNAIPDPVEPIGSLIPSVSTIYPDMPEWRKSRRPLVVAFCAVAAVAAAIFISFGSSHKKAEVTRPVAARITPAAASELPEVASSATPSVAETAVEQAPVAREANVPKATPSSVRPSKRATPTDIAPVAESTRPTRKQVRETDLTVANRTLSEPKASAAESSTPAKSTTASTKKVNSISSSIASWDQGTVETRPWMNPGF